MIIRICILLMMILFAREVFAITPAEADAGIRIDLTNAVTAINQDVTTNSHLRWWSGLVSGTVFASGNWSNSITPTFGDTVYYGGGASVPYPPTNGVIGCSKMQIAYFGGLVSTNVSINGEVWSLSSNLNATIQGDLHLLGNPAFRNCHFGGLARGDVYAGDDVTIDASAVIMGNLVVYGTNSVNFGTIRGDALFSGEGSVQAGIVYGNSYFTADDTTFDNTQTNGVTYGNVYTPDGRSVRGEIKGLVYRTDRAEIWAGGISSTGIKMINTSNHTMYARPEPDGTNGLTTWGWILNYVQTNQWHVQTNDSRQLTLDNTNNSLFVQDPATNANSAVSLGEMQRYVESRTSHDLWMTTNATSGRIGSNLVDEAVFTNITSILLTNSIATVGTNIFGKWWYSIANSNLDEGIYTIHLPASTITIQAGHGLSSGYNMYNQSTTLIAQVAIPQTLFAGAQTIETHVHIFTNTPATAIAVEPYAIRTGAGSADSIVFLIGSSGAHLETPSALGNSSGGGGSTSISSVGVGTSLVASASTVKSIIPGTGITITDGGSNVTINASDAWTYYYQPTNASASNLNTFTSLSGLAFAVEANSIYEIDGYLCFTSAVSTTGIRMGNSAPAFNWLSMQALCSGANLTGGGALNWQTTNFIGAFAVMATSPANMWGGVRTYGTFESSATTGTWTLLFGSEIDNSEVIVRSNSWIRVRKR